MSVANSRLHEDPFFCRGLRETVQGLCSKLYRSTVDRTVYLNLTSWEPKLASHPASGQNIEKDGRHHLTLLAVPQLAFYHVNGEWLYSTDNQHTLVAGPRTLRSGSRESRGHYPETAGGKKFAAGELDDPVKKEEYVYQHEAVNPETKNLHTFRLKQLDVDYFREAESSSSFVNFDLDHTVLLRDGSARKTERYRITFVQQKSSYQQAGIGPSTDAAPSHNRKNTLSPTWTSSQRHRSCSSYEPAI